MRGYSYGPGPRSSTEILTLSAAPVRKTGGFTPDDDRLITRPLKSKNGTSNLGKYVQDKALWTHMWPIFHHIVGNQWVNPNPCQRIEQ